MASKLTGQTIVVIGGSSGIGYGVAKAALLEHAAHVIIGSSSKDKVDRAIERLKADVANASVDGAVTGDVVDGKDTESVKAFFAKLGEVDHLVWTSGEKLHFGEKGGVNMGKGRAFVYSYSTTRINSSTTDVFDVRFWGAATAAKEAKIRKGGSVTLTTGTHFMLSRYLHSDV